jgi:hypothetical protein
MKTEKLDIKIKAFPQRRVLHLGFEWSDRFLALQTLALCLVIWGILSTAGGFFDVHYGLI